MYGEQIQKVRRLGFQAGDVVAFEGAVMAAAGSGYCIKLPQLSKVQKVEGGAV